jgi:cysteinyl-tRNA synthetase
VRVDGHEDVISAGTAAPITRLRPTLPATVTSDKGGSAASGDEAAVRQWRGHREDHLVRIDADEAYHLFTVALDARDADAAGQVMLRLEKAVSDSASARSDSVAVTYARRVLRGMMLELAAVAADGLSDPSQVVAPLVSALLEQRSVARQRRDYAAADHMRDQLANAGIDVRDSHRGVEWSLRERV